MHGGYQIFDFTHYTLSATPVTVSGLLDTISATRGKPAYVVGVKNSSTEFQSFYGVWTPVSTGYETIVQQVATANKIVTTKVVVAANDAVTITSTTIQVG